MARKAWASKVYFEVTNHCNFRCDFCVLEVINVLNLFLNGMTIYGPLVLGLAMLPGAVGVPMPVGALLVAAGAFARQGIMDWQTAFLFA
jgi:hypothetical protein